MGHTLIIAQNPLIFCRFLQKVQLLQADIRQSWAAKDMYSRFFKAFNVASKNQIKFYCFHFKGLSIGKVIFEAVFEANIHFFIGT